MRILKLVFLSLAVFSQITVFASYAPYIDVESKKSTPVTSQNRLGHVEIVQNDIIQLIEKYAQIWSISPELMNSLVKCESSYNRYAVNDTTGVELSIGLSQINLMAHKVTREQAEDPDFALNFMAKHIASGDAPRMWYTCYKKFSTGN